MHWKRNHHSLISEERLRAVARDVIIDLPCALFIVSAYDYRIIFCNESITNYTGDDSSLFLGKRPWDVVPAFEPLSGMFETAVATRKSQYQEGLRIEQDGRRSCWDISVFPVVSGSSGEVEYICIVGIDTTDCEENEAQLVAEQHRLRAVLESLPVGVFIADASGQIIEINKQVYNIWGGSAPYAEDVEQYAEYKGWWPETGERIQAEDWALARAINRGETSRGELVRIERFDGTQGWILNSAAPVRDENGSIIGGVVVIEDITDEVQLRESLEKALQAAEKERERVVALESVSEAGLSTLELEDLLNTLIRRIAKALNSHSCTIMLLDEKTNEFVTEAVFKEATYKGFRIKADQGFVGEIYRRKQTVYVADAENDPMVINPFLKQSGVKTLLGTPLIVRGKVIGVAYVDNLQIVEYAPEDIRLLETTAARAAMAVDNARLYEQLMRSRDELANALDTEKNFSMLLQRALSPKPPSIGAGYSVAAKYVPARAGEEVGGDFYDVFKTSDGRVGILIGDVSGKGIEAASMAAATRSTLRATAYDAECAGEAMTHSNAVLVPQQPDIGAFVTVLLIILDSTTGNFCYCSAGHTPAVLQRASGRMELLVAENPPVGLDTEIEFNDNHEVLELGDKIILCTDGIIEARHDLELFDLEGLQRTIEDNAALKPDELAEVLFSAAEEWARGNFTDDAAVVIVERESETVAGDLWRPID